VEFLVKTPFQLHLFAYLIACNYMYVLVSPAVRNFANASPEFGMHQCALQVFIKAVLTLVQPKDAM